MFQEDATECVDELTLTSPLQLMGTEFQRTAIIGVGLIGGSIGLRMKAMEHAGMIVGHDRPEVLEEALARGAIDRGTGDLAEAVADVDLVVLAVPVDVAERLLPTVLRVARADATVTDTAPVKASLTRLAQSVSDARACYIGGHPLAGSNRQGIANADSTLFENAYWLFTPTADTPAPKKESLLWWARALGAYPLTLEPQLHDRIVALTTHVPFLLACALTDWVARQSEEVPLLTRLCTGGFQSATGMATLPLAAWEAALRTNRREVEQALQEFLAFLARELPDLDMGRLQEVWQHAHAFQRKLQRTRPGDWDANCELVVTLADRPGAIAELAGLLAAHDIGIRDIHMVYVREHRGGTLKIVLESRAEARRALDMLTENGYHVRLRD